jgi:hypothetical protein
MDNPEPFWPKVVSDTDPMAVARDSQLRAEAVDIINAGGDFILLCRVDEEDLRGITVVKPGDCLRWVEALDGAKAEVMEGYLMTLVTIMLEQRETDDDE